MNKLFYFFLIAGYLFIYQEGTSQGYTPDYCGDQTTSALAFDSLSPTAGWVLTGNDADYLYLTFEAETGWDFYSNASYVGPLENMPVYYTYTFHYYSATIPLNYNVAAIPKAQIETDDAGCFVVSAFAYAVNETLGIEGNAFSVLSFSPSPSGYYLDYCWQLCSTNVIEVVGMGVFDQQNTTLPLLEVENIDQVVVEAIYKNDDPYNGPVEFSNNLGDVFTVEPTPGILNYDRLGDGLPLPLTNKVLFTATFLTVDENGISLDQLNNTGKIHSFVAYVFRNVEDADYFSVFDDQHVFFYRNNEFPEPCASSYPVSVPLGAYITEIPIPLASAPRDITLCVPITELANDGRNGFIEMSAGNLTPVLHEFDEYDLGNSLRIETMTLNDVPGDVDHVTVRIWSPCDDDFPAGGDSFFNSGIVLNIDNEPDCFPCDGQISFLKLEYLGDEIDATIKVYTKKVESSKLIASFENVNQGDAISFYGTGNNNKMGSKIRVTINGVNNDYTEIHTSCSQPIAVGMVYSNKSGTQDNFKILEGESANGGPICEVGGGGGQPCGPCDGQMTALTLKYLGDETGAEIKVYKDKVETDKLIASFTGINNGEEFSFVGVGNYNKMGSKIRITINGEDDNYTEIHTSCSQPIGIGFTYWNKDGTTETFEITDGASHEGGPLCENGGGGGIPCGPCDGQITALTLEYLGSGSDVEINVYKDKVKTDKLIASFTGINSGDDFSFVGVGKHNKMGSKIRITINDENNNYTEIHTSCSQPIGIGYTYWNKTGTVETFKILDGASHEGGPLCENGGGGGEPCGPCDGQMTALTLKYLGSEPDAEINVYKDKVQTKKLIASFFGIDNGDEFFFVGVGKHNKLGSKIRITINDENYDYTEIHTSCSQPIGIGYTYWNKTGTIETFEILNGASHKGGPLCDDGEKSSFAGVYYDNVSLEEDEMPVFETSLKVYPNPLKSTSTVEFKVGVTGDVKVELINFYGQKIKEIYRGESIAGAKYAIKLKGHELPTGIYVIRLMNGTDVKQEKLQVIK